MQIERVNYQKTYNLGNYESERIGVDINLMAGDDPVKALDEAKKLVEQYHKENNQHLFHDQTPDVPVTSQIIRQMGPRSREDQIEADIRTCKDVKVLESYKLIAKSNPVLKMAYNEKFQELTHE